MCALSLFPSTIAAALGAGPCASMASEAQVSLETPMEVRMAVERVGWRGCAIARAAATFCARTHHRCNASTTTPFSLSLTSHITSPTQSHCNEQELKELAEAMRAGIAPRIKDR